MVSFDFFKMKFEVNRGTSFFHQGDKPDYVYCVYRGEVLIQHEHLERKEKANPLIKGQVAKSVQDIAVIGPGMIFGELFLIQNSKHKHRLFSAVAQSDCVILKCTVNCFISRLLKFWELK